jgi:hypothetical protein
MSHLHSTRIGEARYDCLGGACIVRAIEAQCLFLSAPSDLAVSTSLLSAFETLIHAHLTSEMWLFVIVNEYSAFGHRCPRGCSACQGL